MSDWGPDWLRLNDGSGIHLPSLKPCRCGGILFTITERLVARENRTPLLTCAVLCPKCVPLRRGETVRGRINVVTSQYFKS